MKERNYTESGRVKMLNFLTLVSVIIGMIFLFGIGVMTVEIVRSESASLEEVGVLVATFISVLAFCYVLYQVNRIVENIRKDRIFHIDNSKCLGRIGVAMCLYSLVDAIINFQTKANLEIFRTSLGSLKLQSFIYLIIGLTAYVFAKVFEEATEIKKENEYTI